MEPEGEKKREKERGCQPRETVESKEEGLGLIGGETHLRWRGKGRGVVNGVIQVVGAKEERAWVIQT